MPISEPIHIQKWIDENRNLLKPPISNQVIYKNNADFIVMVVGGPNARKDFHHNNGEEIFYQLEGTIQLKVIEDNKLRIVTIEAGAMFLLPPKIPHCPVRFENTIGLVIEKHRKVSEMDGFMWFCENCNHKLHEVFAPVSNIVTQLPLITESFYASKDLCTCSNCGTIMTKPTSNIK